MTGRQTGDPFSHLHPTQLHDGAGKYVNKTALKLFGIIRPCKLLNRSFFFYLRLLWNLALIDFHLFLKEINGEAFLLEIDEACEERMELLSQQMAKREGVTEALKASDQMGWVARMNNIRNRAEEIVLHELVYC